MNLCLSEMVVADLHYDQGLSARDWGIFEELSRIPGRPGLTSTKLGLSSLGICLVLVMTALHEVAIIDASCINACSYHCYCSVKD